MFSNVFEKRDTPRIGKPEQIQIVCRSKSEKVASGLEKKHIFANVFFTTLRVASAAKQKSSCDFLVVRQMLFRTFDKPPFVVQARATKQLRLKNVLRFFEIRLFEFPDFLNLFVGLRFTTENIELFTM